MMTRSRRANAGPSVALLGLVAAALQTTAPAAMALGRGSGIWRPTAASRHRPATRRAADNVFERGPRGTCGYRDPVMDFDASAPGNAWSGNTWDDGAPVTS